MVHLRMRPKGLSHKEIAESTVQDPTDTFGKKRPASALASILIRLIPGLDEENPPGGRLPKIRSNDQPAETFSDYDSSKIFRKELIEQPASTLASIVIRLIPGLDEENPPGGKLPKTPRP